MVNIGVFYDWLTKKDVARRRSNALLARIFQKRRKTRVSARDDVCGNESLTCTSAL